jgi:hypothetical protein
LSLVVALGLLFSGAISNQALYGAIVAYQVPAGVVGNQSDAAGASFGMDFQVNSAVTVSELGVFDSGQNGLLGPIEVAIYDRVTDTPSAR